MGNAAFHSSELYSELSLCIQPLSAALLLPTTTNLQSPYAVPDAEQWAADEKTRANAAGAVGNLIRLGCSLVSSPPNILAFSTSVSLRNSGQLSGLMAEFKVPQQLMSIVVSKFGNEIVTQVCIDGHSSMTRC